MNAREEYLKFLNDIFGEGTIQIDINDEWNNVTRTFCYKYDFCEFKQNFYNRLVRLRKVFEGTESYAALLNKVREVAFNKNWDGAYAELVAYDVLGSCGVKLELEKTLNASDSFTQDLGGAKTNEDGLLADYGIYFDVKRLGDTTRDILQSMVEGVKKDKSFGNRCHVHLEYQIDDDDDTYKSHLNDLRKELLSSLTEGTELINSHVIDGLRYHVTWDAGVSSAISTYDPYRHAENWKDLVFKRYTKKILKNNKFFLVFVNFPWYNTLINDFGGSNAILYRSLARRTFCGYMHSDVPMNSILPQFMGTDTVFDVSKHISGMIFMEDNSINKDTYSCYTYLNPNAIHSVKETTAFDFLQHVVNGSENGTGILDTLQYDNY